ncbi:TPA: hypothetical protein ACHK3R_005625, partial [Escherichia coli]
ATPRFAAARLPWFDLEYHSEEELNLVDPRPKAGVISINAARKKPTDAL